MFNIDKIRSCFPSLNITDNSGNNIIFLDGPGGTQTPQNVIDAISNYYHESNANTHGSFLTSNRTDAVMDETRKNVSIFLGAENKNTISIGHNMTTLCFGVARALSKSFKKNDEVIITQLDHEANRGPWNTLKSYGIKIREIKLLKTGELDYEDFENKINDKTKLVALGMSSNALGTVNNFIKIGKLLENHKSMFLLDAVHYAPHFSIDVQKFKCDFLICSSYKFYGPHLGFIYCKPGILDNLETERLITQNQSAPFRIETGTLNHAACAGANAAIKFVANIGMGNNLREKLENAYSQIGKHEHNLASILFEEIKKLKNFNTIGVGFDSLIRTPTVSFVHKSRNPKYICDQLAKKNICGWNGHFYAVKAIQILGLEKIGGVTRLGVSVYNTEKEIRKTVDIISKI